MTQAKDSFINFCKLSTAFDKDYQVQKSPEVLASILSLGGQPRKIFLLCGRLRKSESNPKCLRKSLHKINPKRRVFATKPVLRQNRGLVELQLGHVIIGMIPATPSMHENHAFDHKMWQSLLVYNACPQPQTEATVLVSPSLLQIDTFGKWCRCLHNVCYVKLKKRRYLDKCRLSALAGISAVDLSSASDFVKDLLRWD